MRLVKTQTMVSYKSIRTTWKQSKRYRPIYILAFNIYFRKILNTLNLSKALDQKKRIKNDFTKKKDLQASEKSTKANEITKPGANNLTPISESQSDNPSKYFPKSNLKIYSLNMLRFQQENVIYLFRIEQDSCRCSTRSRATLYYETGQKEKIKNQKQRKKVN